MWVVALYYAWWSQAFMEPPEVPGLGGVRHLSPTPRLQSSFPFQHHSLYQFGLYQFWKIVVIYYGSFFLVNFITSAFKWKCSFF